MAPLRIAFPGESELRLSGGFEFSSCFRLDKSAYPKRWRARIGGLVRGLEGRKILLAKFFK